MGNREEYEKVNKPIYEGIDAFRAWLDGEIRELGPQSVVQDTVNNLIAQNRELRDRLDRGVLIRLGKTHYICWSRKMMRLFPKQLRNASLKIVMAMFLKSTRCTRKMGVYYPPNWIKNGTGVGQAMENSGKEFNTDDFKILIGKQAHAEDLVYEMQGAVY